MKIKENVLGFNKLTWKNSEAGYRVVFPVHAMRAYRRIRGLAPLILNHGLVSG
jgi:hypothetical protein